MNADFPIIGIGASESREDDGPGSEDGEKRLHFFFLGNRLSNRSDNVKATFAIGVDDPTPYLVAFLCRNAGRIGLA